MNDVVVLWAVDNLKVTVNMVKLNHNSYIYLFDSDSWKSFSGVFKRGLVLFFQIKIGFLFSIFLKSCCVILSWFHVFSWFQSKNEMNQQGWKQPKKCFNQLLGACGTQKLVKIHNIKVCIEIHCCVILSQLWIHLS